MDEEGNNDNQKNRNGFAGEPEGSDELDEIERVGSVGEFAFAST
jgi:hypothetical protein